MAYTPPPRDPVPGLVRLAVMVVFIITGVIGSLPILGRALWAAIH